jgi:hypothetical protein
MTAIDGRVVAVRAACTTLAGWNGRADLDARGRDDEWTDPVAQLAAGGLLLRSASVATIRDEPRT